MTEVETNGSTGPLLGVIDPKHGLFRIVDELAQGLMVGILPNGDGLAYCPLAPRHTEQGLKSTRQSSVGLPSEMRTT